MFLSWRAFLFCVVFRLGCWKLAYRFNGLDCRFAGWLIDALAAIRVRPRPMTGAGFPHAGDSVFDSNLNYFVVCFHGVLSFGVLWVLTVCSFGSVTRLNFRAIRESQRVTI